MLYKNNGNVPVRLKSPTTGEQWTITVGAQVEINEDLHPIPAFVSKVKAKPAKVAKPAAKPAAKKKAVKEEPKTEVASKIDKE